MHAPLTPFLNACFQLLVTPSPNLDERFHKGGAILTLLKQDVASEPFEYIVTPAL
jgi:hypothetical protein